VRHRARMAIAFAASAAVHALALGVRIRAPAVERTAVSAPRLLAIETTPATRVYDIVPVAREPEGPRLAPEPDPRPAGPAPARPPVAPTVPPGTSIRPPPTPAAAGPDPRLWRSPAAVAAAPDPLAPAREAVGARLQPFNDSLVAVEEAARRAKEWTKRDGSGGVWGLTPDSIHFGGMAIPLRRCNSQPCPEDVTYKGPPGLRDEYNARLRGFRAIEEQAARGAVEKAIRDRIRAMRERDAKRDTTGTSLRP